MRFKTMMLAALAIATPPAAQAARQAAIPDRIGIVEGRAGATHRLTLVSAFSCPYCRAFDQQAMDEIRRVWIPRGLQLETIPVIISPTDAAAGVAATCGDPRGYARRSTILFRAQPEILSNWRTADEGATARAVALPEGQGIQQIATLSGIVALAPSLGLTRAELARCLSDPAARTRPYQRDRLAAKRWNVQGTPTAFLDGRQVGNTWQSVRAALAATLR